ncbi:MULTISPECIES: hypothetical protein [unclassified Bradyrhizobium]|uniref:hypothetical protein n=1 Tax=Bradyrhizobium sp. USDA 4541 TaxID=2817704 RepID=UPI0020A5E593|nr:hypothetical protein [Bradyrhizobium sp. USDA 4541]MCP1848454.1 hypothetical protein [Bradyrhizobium sp. USDA 4541]
MVENRYGFHSGFMRFRAIGPGGAFCPLLCAGIRQASLPFGAVAADQLTGDIVEIIADDLRLRADGEDIVAGTLDQRGLPAGRDRAQRVPGVAGDQAELRGLAPSSFST